MPSVQGLNLARELQGPWQHAVITTYGLDLAFFERAILPQLSQARGRVILADGQHLLSHQAEAARGRMIRHANRSYVVGGITTPNAAHSKIIMLLSGEAGRLLVGSGNLRLTGWGAVGEMFTRYELTAESREHLGAFLGAKSMLDGLAERGMLDDFAAGFLRQIWDRVPWLAEPRGSTNPGPVRHNLDLPLADQLVAETARLGPVSKLTLFAPFHDPGCSVTKVLLEQLHPARASLLIHPKDTSVDSRQLGQLLEAHPELDLRTFGVAGDEARYVHAKFVLAQGADYAVCLQGSPNLSTVAMLKTVGEGNVEAANILVAGPKAFDDVLAALTISGPITDLASLGVCLASMAPPSIAGAGDVRLLEASWQGDLIYIRLQASRGLAQHQHLWIRIGQELVETEVLDQQADQDHVGLWRLTLRGKGLEKGAVFTRATPVAIYLGAAAPSELVTDDDLSNPVYCINQQFLFEHLEARPATARMRDIGSLSLDDDRQLEDLIRALEGTMVFDRKTLIEARPPTSAVEPNPDDESLMIAYADVDYEALRASPRLQQYRAGLHVGSGGAGFVGPSDIQLALRSITDAFGDIVGRAAKKAAHVSFQSEWEDDPSDEAAEQTDPGMLQADVENEEEAAEQGVDIEAIEEQAERRWSTDARLRLHWRNFVGRYLMGLSSPNWRELVGTAVLSANYEVFSHVLQRLHRQPWQDFDFVEFLLQAQASTHGFAWGSGEDSGWLAGLNDDHADLVLQTFEERRVAVRLLVDLAAGGSLTSPGDFDAWEALVDERIALRDVARSVLTHPSWARLVDADSRLLPDSTAIAADMVVSGDFSCWMEPPRASDLVEELEALANFTSFSELQHELGKVVGVPWTNVELTEVLLGPDGHRHPAHEVSFTNDPPIDRTLALELMARLIEVLPGPRYRVVSGKRRLIYDRNTGVAQWSPSILDDGEIIKGLPTIAKPWDEPLMAIRRLTEALTQPAVA